MSERASDVLAALVELDCPQQFLESALYVAVVSFDDRTSYEKVKWLRHVLDLSEVGAHI